MCKKLTFMLMVLAVVGLAVPASATYWVGGEPMTDNGDGTHSVTLTGLGAGAHYDFNIYDDVSLETWPSGANSWFYADGGGSITIGFNTNTVIDGWLPAQYRIGLSTDGNNVGWVIAGSFGEPLGPGLPDWSLTGIVMNAMGGGIYEVELALPLGGGPSWTPNTDTYAWKSVVYGTWDSISEDGRSVNTANAMIQVLPGWEGARFTVDAYTGVVKAELIPEPATCLILGLGIVGLVMRRRRC